MAWTPSPEPLVIPARQRIVGLEFVRLESELERQGDVEKPQV